MKIALLFTIVAGYALPIAVSAAEIKITVKNPDGFGVGNAAVYAVPQPGANLPPPVTAELDQVNLQFVPPVSVVQVGAPVHFPNSDNVRHQVYSFSAAKTFSLKLYSGRPSEPVIFDKPGVVVLGCNIHDEMVAWVLVVETHWFAVTGKDGTATLGNLPAGDYVLHTWHPAEKKPAAEQRIHLDAAEVTVRTINVDTDPLPIPVPIQH